MGWKGNVRSINSALRSMERESQRRHRELVRQQKEIEKMEEIQKARYEVNVYNNHIDLITSIHKEWGNQIDWEGILNEPLPEEPRIETTHQDNLKIRFFNKLLGQGEKLLKQAEEKDTSEYKTKYEVWKSNCKELQENKKIASELLSGDRNAKIELIAKINSFEDIRELGASLSFENESGIVEANFNSLGKSIVPTESKTLLKSGKLSVKKLSGSRFNEIYQDYICSCILRIGNELLAIIPDDLVLVHTFDQILNSSTGHSEEQCVLSVAVSRKVIANLNLDMIDPSDSLENFVNNMNFKKTKGFDPVEKLQASRFV